MTCSNSELLFRQCSQFPLPLQKTHYKYTIIPEAILIFFWHCLWQAYAFLHYLHIWLSFHILSLAKEQSWPWSYGGYIYTYLFYQWVSPLTLWVLLAHISSLSSSNISTDISGSIEPTMLWMIHRACVLNNFRWTFPTWPPMRL